MPDVLSDGLFWLTVVLCAIAQFFIVRAVLMPEPPPPAGSPAETGRAAGRLRSPSRPLEVAWAVLPAVGLVLLFAWAWELKHPALPSPILPATSAASGQAA
jgi:hypothetical protein